MQSPGRGDRHLLLDAFDRAYRARGAEVLAGVDEAGRGALAGPVVAAAVVLPPSSDLVGVRDSKQVGELEREELFSEIVEKAAAVGIAFSNPGFIDRHNILVATLAAMSAAIARLKVPPQVAIVDGRDAPAASCAVIPVIGGDRLSLSIAAASIIAKVARDRWMRKLHQKHPVYNFLKNKGYGTQEHVDAIQTYGMTSTHRKSFRVKSIENIPHML
ncbi:MAG: ribonuclease HII [Chitinivibrionia bacterium]|nr:ribonuclease HII [Chitinivibrionia bacterium]